MPRMPIQDEPESTIGRKPEELSHRRAATPGANRSGAALRREQGDDTEAQRERPERERGEPPSRTGLAEPGLGE